MSKKGISISSMNRKLYEILNGYYRNPKSMEILWTNKNEFSRILCLALDVDLDCSVKTNLHRCAEYFVNYTIVFLIKKIDDFPELFKVMNDKRKKILFMNRYFSNDLISYEMVCMILNSEETIQEIGSYSEWIEYPLMLRTSYLLSTIKTRELSETEIIPFELELSCSFQEYLLSWVFEEGKLSKSGVDYFRNNFKNKYNHLCNIINKYEHG